MIQEEQEEGEGDGEGEGEEAGEEERENEKKVIRQSLVDFYSRRDPAKVAQVDTVMERYRGREHEILSVIAKAEKETPPQPQQQQQRPPPQTPEAEEADWFAKLGAEFESAAARGLLTAIGWSELRMENAAKIGV
jgi:hypothetical protein